jgi:hypothetical protein
MGKTEVTDSIKYTFYKVKEKSIRIPYMRKSFVKLSKNAVDSSHKKCALT